MAGIVYPNGFDTFTEPTLPESTSLSSPGTGSRNHVEHHRDLGDAIEALERGAQYRDHDHSGDATDIHKGAKLKQANTHENCDVDSSPTAQHHTIGLGANQAAAGNHVHDYSQLTGAPYYRCTSTARPPNPTPGLMIWETDTSRMRVWSTFPGNALNPGLFSADYFNRVGANDLGSALWEQVYYATAGAANGKMATPDGATASWTDGTTNTWNRCLARRVNSIDAQTITDDQIVTFRTGASVIENEFPWFEGQASNDAYLRLSADRNSYVRVGISYNNILVYYTISGWNNEQKIGQLTNVETDIPGAEWRVQMVGNDITIYRDGTAMGTVTDTRQLAAKGANNRGWGIGMIAGNRLLAGQVTPANVDYVNISDYITRTAISRWTLLPMANLPITRLRQAQTQKFQSTGTIVQWTEALEDTFGFFDLRAPTDIRCTEPGLYNIDFGVQWDSQIVPDVGIVAVVLNGTETTLRNQQALRGNGYNPGFSQTITMSGKIRLSMNDVLQIKASYVTANSFLNQIFSFFNTNNKIQSRIELTYVSP